MAEFRQRGRFGCSGSTEACNPADERRIMEAVRLLSPRELGTALGVSESSLKRWIDAGKIIATRTDGGHRRISLPEAVRFIRETGAPLAHPEILDMPEVATAHEKGLRGNDRLLGYLERGDALGARGFLMACYLGGASVAELCDGAIRDAMHALGELWNHSSQGVFVEHRGTECCLQALAYLRATFDVPVSAPVALGGAPEDDPYLLPSFMASMVIESAGLRAVNLGPDTPLAALQHAVAAHQPRVIWISASTKVAPARARALANWLGSLPSTTVAVIGGREGERIVAGHPALRYAETMAELATIAAKIAR